MIIIYYYILYYYDFTIMILLTKQNNQNTTTHKNNANTLFVSPQPVVKGARASIVRRESLYHARSGMW